MKNKILLLVFSAYLFCNAQELQTGTLGNFKLTSGQEIIDCMICYRTIGTLNEQKTNAILYPSWFGGKSESLIKLSKSIFDTLNYYIILVDALGNGISSSPSNSISQKDSLFPDITIKDMVNSEYVLLTKVLGINHLAAVMGGSMGGMQVFQWVVSYPGFMDKAIAYVGSPRLTAFDLMLWSTEIQSIEYWEKTGGSREDLAGIITTIHNLLLTTPENKNQKIKREKFPDYLSDLKENFIKTFEPFDWKIQLKAMYTHDISINGSLEEAAGKIKADFLIIAGTQDNIVNPAPAIEFADKYHFKKYIFNNNCGHLSPGCEFPVFVKLINDFINEKTLN